MTSAPDQTAAATAARRRQTQDKLLRVEKAIGQLRCERSRLAVRAIAQRAGVSTTFLYENADARRLVQAAVTNSKSRHDRAAQEEHERIEASWRERALNAEEELTRAQNEILAQRQRIGELMGQLRDFEQMVPDKIRPTARHREHHPQAPVPPADPGTPSPAGTARRRPIKPPLHRQTHHRPRSPTPRTGPAMTLQPLPDPVVLDAPRPSLCSRCCEKSSSSLTNATRPSKRPSPPNWAATPPAKPSARRSASTPTPSKPPSRATDSGNPRVTDFYATHRILTCLNCV
ncbi:DUF6262 family protein [Streptomyces sp. WG7]|uniref:DUF6262 family protein n=1 Tax=Streptomyces sp. WG7 TaxID=3417650 RepID=UPI003CF769E6